MQKRLQKKDFLLDSRGLILTIMMILTLSSAIALIVLVLLQVRDGGLNVSSTNTLQAPIERR